VRGLAAEISNFGCRVQGVEFGVRGLRLEV
jgi:hypothetical protein